MPLTVEEVSPQFILGILPLSPPPYHMERKTTTEAEKQ